jgi:hypothetical protein
MHSQKNERPVPESGGGIQIAHCCDMDIFKYNKLFFF